MNIMNWFKRNREEKPISIEPPAQSRVEVELHKNANKEAKEKAENANAHLNELLVQNGFTLKIYLAAGGRYKDVPHSRGQNK